MTYLVIIAFLTILVSLGFAFIFMVRGNRNGAPASPKIARALAWRVGLSIALFVFILVTWRLGYIHPTGIPQGQ